MGRHQDDGAFIERARVAELERPDAGRQGRAQEAEAGGVVVGDDLGGCAPAAGGDLDRFGLEDQIADGDDQPGGVDHDAAAAAHGSQRLRRARVRRHLDIDPDHGGTRHR